MSAHRPEGPSERFVPCAVWSGLGHHVTGCMYSVLDRQTGQYVQTLPRRFYARESARLCALSLNRGRSPRVQDVAVYDRVSA